MRTTGGLPSNVDLKPENSVQLEAATRSERSGSPEGVRTGNLGSLLLQTGLNPAILKHPLAGAPSYLKISQQLKVSSWLKEQEELNHSHVAVNMTIERYASR